MLLNTREMIYFKLFLSFATAFLLVFLPNYQYAMYHSLSPLTTQDIEKQGSEKSIGYPAAEDVSEAKNLEDIEKYYFFTVTVDRSDLTPTGYYQILDPSETGYTYGTRKHRSTHYVGQYLNNDLIAYVRNKTGPAMGQFYVLDLNGEKAIVLLHPPLLKGSGTIRLPVGKVATSYPVQYFKAIQTKYGLQKENSTFYMNMAGSNWVTSPEMEKLGIIQGIAFFMVAIIAYFLFTKLISRLLFSAEENRTESDVLPLQEEEALPSPAPTNSGKSAKDKSLRQSEKNGW